jgi:hypothetical protein
MSGTPSSPLSRASAVRRYVEGDGETFDYGVDYIECETVKFLTERGTLELAPYICPTDILYSQALDWGLKCTITLAKGAECCDFRFKKGSATQVAMPEPLEKVMQSWRPSDGGDSIVP